MINIEVNNSAFPLINSLYPRTTVQHLRRFGLFGILNCFNARVERLTATPPFRWCRQSASSRLPGSAAGCKLHGIHAEPACLPHSVALQGSINFLARPALMKCRRWDCHPCLPPTACCLLPVACLICSEWHRRARRATAAIWNWNWIGWAAFHRSSVQFINFAVFSGKTNKHHRWGRSGEGEDGGACGKGLRRTENLFIATKTHACNQFLF